jgi:hypothetical protein
MRQRLRTINLPVGRMLHEETREWRALPGALPCACGAQLHRNPSTAKRRPAVPGVQSRTWYQWGEARSASTECGAVAYIVFAVDVNKFRSIELSAVVCAWKVKQGNRKVVEWGIIARILVVAILIIVVACVLIVARVL